MRLGEVKSIPESIMSLSLPGLFPFYGVKVTVLFVYTFLTLVSTFMSSKVRNVDDVEQRQPFFEIINVFA